jgi:hypothetical protein
MNETKILAEAKTEPQIFWMLLVEGTGSCSAKHFTQEAAEKECERLARVSGKKVHILKTVGSMELERILPPVLFTKY